MKTNKRARRACRGSKQSLTLGMVLGAALLAGGCEGESDSAARSVKSTAAKLHAVAGGGPVSSHVGGEGKVQSLTKEEQKYLTEAQTEAQSLTQNSRPAIAASGSLLAAQASMAKAQVAAATLGDVDRRLLNRLGTVRSLLGGYAEQDAAANSAGGFIPAERLAEIDASKKQKAGQIEKHRATKAKIDEEIRTLRQQSKQKMDAAKVEFDEAARLTEQASKLTATEASPLVEQAAGRSRAGDALRKDGLYLEAQAALAEPRAAEQELYIEQLTAQIAGLDETGQALTAKQGKLAATAQEARAAASKLAGEISAEIRAMSEMRTGEWVKAFDETAGAYKAALSAAQKAQQDNPTQAKLAVGSAQQGLANLHWRKAQTLGVLASAYNALASVEPALPDAGSYKEQASTLTAEQKTAVEDAAAAFEAAKSAFTTVTVRGAAEVKERLDKLGDVLDKSGQVAKGEALDLLGEYLIKRQSGSAAKAAPATSSNAGAPAGDVPAELTATLEKWLKATKDGDAEATIALYRVDPADRPTFEAMSTLAAKGAKLDRAFRAKFNSSLAQAAGAMPGVGGALGVGVGDLKVSDITVTVTGDTAKAEAASLPALNLVKADGQWYLTPGETMRGPQAMMAAQMARPLGKAMDEITAEVEAGQHASVEAAMGALQAKIMAAMGAPPPGGG